MLRNNCYVYKKEVRQYKTNKQQIFYFEVSSVDITENNRKQYLTFSTLMEIQYQGVVNLRAVVNHYKYFRKY